MSSIKPAKYVYIPCDPNEVVEERLFKCKEGADPAMAFINVLKAHFQAASGGVDKATAVKAHQQSILQQAGKGASNITPELLSMVSDMQMVETIALMPNRPDTGYIAVNMYCDDSATFKQLPVNMRATQLAAACGLTLQISGDVFIGRIFDNEDDFRRDDFPMSDMNSSSQWMQRAREINLQKSNRSGAMQQQWVDMQQAAQQQRSGAGAGSTSSNTSSSSPAEQEKDMGNVAFKKGDWRAALDHYSAALKLDPSMLPARNNRALVYLKLSMPQQALDDCTAVVSADSNNIKALLRRAAAAAELGQLPAAQADVERVLELQPTNKDAAQQLQQIKQASSTN